jgi:hypothetical protein
MLAGLAMVFSRGETALLPINDNTSPPYLGVVDLTTNTDAFATWLNRTSVFGNGVFAGGPGSDWNSLATVPKWFFDPATHWILERPGRIMVIGVPILPGPTNDSGPTTGPEKGPVSLAAGAQGRYNKYFYAMGRNLVANHLGGSILRLGWEFNGDWYAWHVTTAADAAHFSGFWKQIVDTLRTVPGQNFRFLWGGALTYVGPHPAYPLAQAFPSGNDANGRAYVDYVGLDIYDESWAYYPWPKGATAQQVEAARAKVWSDTINTRVNYWGIPVWTDLAKAHHLPFTIPEWGASGDAHGGQDDTAFIQHMYQFIQDPANNVFFAAYYDSETSKLSPTHGYVTALPQAASLYRKLFGLPVPALPR